MKKFSSITRVNSRHTSRNKKIQRVVIIGVTLVILLFLIPKFFAFAVSFVLSPVHHMQYWLSQSGSSFPSYLRDRKELIKEIDELKSSLASNSGERYTLQLLSKENTELRALLGDTEEKRIAAGIIGRPNKLPYDVLVLDKGGDDGIVEGAPVFIGNNSVIGTIRKVFPKTAVVELITTPGFSASVYIVGPNIYTNAEGIGGGQMRVGVPQGITLSVDNLVILPSIASGVYGKISVVDSVPTRPEQYGYVSPEIPIASLRLVSVGDTPLEPVSFEEAQEIVAHTQKELFKVPVPEGLLITSSSTASTTATSTGTASTSTTIP